MLKHYYLIVYPFSDNTALYFLDLIDSTSFIIYVLREFLPIHFANRKKDCPDEVVLCPNTSFHKFSIGFKSEL